MSGRHRNLKPPAPCYAVVLLAMLAQTAVAVDSPPTLPPLGTLDVTIVRDNKQSEDPELTKRIVSLFKERKFADLEALAANLRKTREQYNNGVWRLSQFYIALSEPAENENWQDYLSRMEDWMKKYPDSITAPVAYSEALTSYAWHARGSGWANSVTEEGWKLFTERIAKARQVLDAAARKPQRCPRCYKDMLLIAQAQSWTKPKYDAVFQQGIAAAPDYYSLYFQKANFLQTRWFGGKGEWENFAEASAKSLGGVEGDILYARIVWFIHQYYGDDNLKEANLDVPRLKRGFDALLNRHPQDLEMRTEYAMLMILTGDKARAQELFKEIGNRVFISLWITKRKFFEFRKSTVHPQ